MLTRQTRPTIVLSALISALLLAVGLFATAPPVEASVMVPLSLDTLKTEAESIVYARTLYTESRWAQPETGDIETVVHLEVLQVAKGHAEDEITVVVPGGTIGDLTVYVDSMPQFSLGETAILFLDAKGRIVGDSQGRLPVATGRVTSLNRAAQEVLAELSDPAGGLVSGHSSTVGARLIFRARARLRRSPRRSPPRATTTI